MGSIEVFWEYLHKYHPILVSRDWLMDNKVISLEEIVNQEVKASIPSNMFKLKCNVFFYEGGTNVVFLLQDERGENDIAIGLLKNNELKHVISLL